MTDNDPAAPLKSILARIAAAAVAAGRDPAAVTLVAVSKQQPWSSIEPILAAGQGVFGENRVQEAAGRWKAERRDGVELRLIGPLQTNKVAEAAALFDVIETLDRPKLARALAEAFSRAGRAPALYVQVNTGRGAAEGGRHPGCEADVFIAACRGEYGLSIDGLMCVPPLDEEPALHFALLAKIARRNGLERLSMRRMSEDFETAVRLGATSVRVGSALFGARSLERTAI